MNNSMNFTGLSYERYLSMFGRIVLGNLIKNLEERNNFNTYQIASQDRFRVQNKRVLNFDDSHDRNSSSISRENLHTQDCQNLCNRNVNNITSLSTCNKDVSLPIIPTSDELLNIVDENSVSHTLNEPKIELLNETNRKRIKHQSKTEKNLVENSLNNIPSVEKHIEWDDIFDTQLLRDLYILDNDSNISADKEIAVVSISDKPNSEWEKDACNKNSNKIAKGENILKTFQHFNSASVTNTDNILEMKNKENILVPKNIKESHKVGIDSENEKNFQYNKTKCKRSNSTKITDEIPKKVKKSQVDAPKNTLRKLSYTKAVKNWLNDVNTNKNDDIVQPQTSLDAENEKTEFINETANKTNKKILDKTIQAQLTNKNGIMKYGKPKNISHCVEKVKDQILQNNAASKDRKVKPKFVAPIKSQIPIKDIIFTVNIIDDCNYMKFEKDLLARKNEEIDIVLVFSNGYCQLNSHYTEDTCVVEGMMFQCNNIIYYLKGTQKNFWVTLKNIIVHNTTICYDGKNLLKYFASQYDLDFIDSKICILDTQIGGSLVDPDNPPEDFTQLQKLLNFAPEYTIATECTLQKCAWYLTMLGECFVKLRNVLLESELWKVFIEIEMKVLPIIAEMERRGVRVDTERLKSMESTLLTRMKLIEQACHKAAGRAFQINSTLQVRNILYEELQLDTKCNIKIRETLCKGEKSTSESMLRNLVSVHPLPKLILEYRHLHKAHATFLAGIANQVKDGIVKPTWVQTAAATGRIASNNPNLQAIPKAPFSLVMFPPSNVEGGEVSAENNQVLNFRSVYVPRVGHTMLAADFKHIECRVFAYAAADTSLLDALSSPDLFRVLAARWLGKSVEEISSEDRDRTKRIVYASLYGAGTRKLMEILDVGYDHALSIMSSFNRTFPSLKSFGRSVVGECAARGRVVAPSGRARPLRHITSRDVALRSHAQRQAINFIVQGTAADLCKMAMVASTERMRSAEPPIYGHLLLQIHDELVWEVPHHDLERAAAIIKSAMEDIGHKCGMAMKFPVAISRGPSWGELEELKYDEV